jgi:stress-induced morphogen|tara:strand:- start:11173 stop:11484 length:312 start_codon:yes stop_codon:yes gene_type:complete
MTKESIESAIKKAIKKSYNPVHIDIVNESFMHNVPKDSESHFKLLVVSNFFKNMTLIQRHKHIYSSLNEVMKNIHALSINAYDIEEFKLNPTPPSSPDCANKK